MVIDTSAIVAVMFSEPGRDLFLERLALAKSRQMSAVSYMEAGMVLTSHFGNAAEDALDLLLNKANIPVVPVDLHQARIALEAFRKYGKGRHPAGLKFGDCFSYALAKSSGELLLFKGAEFAKADIQAA